MIDDKMRPKVNAQPEQAKPEEVKHAQQDQVSAAAEPGQHPAQGRRPLFRN